MTLPTLPLSPCSAMSRSAACLLQETMPLHSQTRVRVGMMMRVPCAL